eukprot:6583524-Prymnesium_polylepis.2
MCGDAGGRHAEEQPEAHQQLVGRQEVARAAHVEAARLEVGPVRVELPHLVVSRPPRRRDDLRLPPFGAADHARARLRERDGRHLAAARRRLHHRDGRAFDVRVDKDIRRPEVAPDNHLCLLAIARRDDQQVLRSDKPVKLLKPEGRADRLDARVHLERLHRLGRLLLRGAHRVLRRLERLGRLDGCRLLLLVVGARIGVCRQPHVEPHERCGRGEQLLLGVVVLGGEHELDRVVEQIERVHHRCERVALLLGLDHQARELLPVHPAADAVAQQRQQRIDLLHVELDEPRARHVSLLLVPQPVDASLLCAADLVDLLPRRVLLLLIRLQRALGLQLGEELVGRLRKGGKMFQCLAFVLKHLKRRKLVVCAALHRIARASRCRAALGAFRLVLEDNDACGWRRTRLMEEVRGVTDSLDEPREQRCILPRLTGQLPVGFDARREQAVVAHLAAQRQRTHQKFVHRQ